MLFPLNNTAEGKDGEATEDGKMGDRAEGKSWLEEEEIQREGEWRLEGFALALLGRLPHEKEGF